MFLRSLLPILLMALPLVGQTRVFRLDENHTVLGFKASTLLFDVPGRFTRYKADIQGDPVAPEDAKIQIDIDARSISTAIQARDEHLRSADFFDVAKFPRITFTSQNVHREGDRVVVRGTLTMHGVSRELELPFVTAEGLNGAGANTWSYRTTLALDRLDFGIGADSVAAKISLKRPVELDLLLVGFFVEPAAAAKPASARKSPGPTTK
jgi:polyisoprenoid-binding protein YceI